MKPLRHLPLLSCLLLLSACSSISEVTPAGKDQYRVSYNAGMRAMTWVELKNATRDRAKAYCEAQGQRMVRPEVTSNHATGLMPKEAIVTFSCEALPEPSAPAGKAAS
ncbi:lipoprotein [Bordetella ansorpii]|uniref:Lipoprotein n=1 Tax=Bordetella ansorpii TaxID=288768 RepID=A0A157RGS7_9BORD|nr:hypothetical protein [Bordetella ansorpii]SAI57136.1 lipoprotein [Bordetella ansorpii]